MELDIIIPTYNAKGLLKRLLFSIATQKKISGYHVYIVNDCSDYDYTLEVDFFKQYMDITELKLSVNSGPGIAREYGIKNSSGKYILFIDADDYLYNPYSIYNLYECINNNDADLVISDFLYERDNEIKIISKNNTWLHGKIFRRNFIEENDIHFNNTRANEDNGFNRLVLFHNPKLIYLNEITYIYSENANSITRKDNRLYKFTGLEWYTYNMYWAINIAIEKGLNMQQVCLSSLGVLTSMYYYYLELYDEYDVRKILIWSKEIKKVYDDFKDKYILDSTILDYLNFKENEYKNRKFNKFIEFNEFLDRIDGEPND